jgi:DivIVA domain-containing protein
MLTPEEITSREFLVSLRGYDRDEVHSFLDQVARHVEDLQAQVETLQSGQSATALAAYPPDPDVVPPVPAADANAFFADLGKTTQRILEAAHEAGSEIQRRARNEAEHELADARARAVKLVAEGQRRREVIEGVVHMLEERRVALADDLRSVAATVEQVLKDLAPRGQMLPPGELVAVARLDAPDASWTPDTAVAELEAPAVEHDEEEETDDDLTVDFGDTGALPGSRLL